MATVDTKSFIKIYPKPEITGSMLYKPVTIFIDAYQVVFDLDLGYMSHPVLISSSPPKKVSADVEGFVDKHVNR